MKSSRARQAVVAGLVTAVTVALLPTTSTAQAIEAPEPELVPAPELLVRERATVPSDRYELAGGCYALQSLETGAWLTRTADGIAATAPRADAEPLRFQATELGQYLLFGTAEDFLSATTGEGEQLDAALDTVEDHALVTRDTQLPRSIDDDLPAGAALADVLPDLGTIGSDVELAGAPSPAADWRVDGDGTFTFTLPATGQLLVANSDGSLQLADAAALGQSALFQPRLVDGCATYPEITVNVDGAPVRGVTSYQEARGYLDAHLHTMAYEFLGGRARCGRPWHRYGVTHALVDCPDHEPGGSGAVLENVLKGGTPVDPHDTTGWPTFADWPAHNSLTHEGVYYKWLERAWRGGLRMMTTLLVDNNALCEIYPYKKNSCNEMDGVRLQAQRLREFENYIDAQSGGPGTGWFRIVTSPEQARAVMNSGRLAVIMGIEVSVLFDCGEYLDQARCNEADIDREMDAVYDLGVRQMELLNKFDSALSGVAGDGGSTGVLVNGGNKLETGHFWQMTTCDEPEGHELHAHDNPQYNVVDGYEGNGAPEEVFGRDALAGAILDLFGTSGVAPVYPQGPHCNVRGLTELGAYLIRGMAERGMIFDPDHMSAKGRSEAMDVIDALGYDGVVSSHSWADDPTYRRIYRAGGTITPYPRAADRFVDTWRRYVGWAAEANYFGIGYGADMNGFGAQSAPRGADAENAVTYPFTGFGGVTVHQQVSGERVYDVNLDGVAHYGMYPDWIEEAARQAGPDREQFLADMSRGPEAYLQTWERALGIAPNACFQDVQPTRADVMAHVRRGMTTTEVLAALGQPASRIGDSFEYCADANGTPATATVTFDADGIVRTRRVQPGRFPVSTGQPGTVQAAATQPVEAAGEPAAQTDHVHGNGASHVHAPDVPLVTAAGAPRSAGSDGAAPLRTALLVAGLAGLAWYATRRAAQA